MDLKISPGLKLEVRNTFTREGESNGIWFYVFGSFTGLIDNYRYYNSEEGFQKLIGAYGDEKKFQSLIGNAIGSFNLVVWQEGKNFQVYTSLKGPGFFLLQDGPNLELIEDERQLYKRALKFGLNSYEVLHHVTHHFAFRSPYQPMVNQTERILGGQKLVIDSKCHYQKTFYLDVDSFHTNRKSLSGNYERFKYLMETITQNAFESYKRKQNYVQVSGGIDSAITLVAALKTGYPFTALHDTQNPKLENIIRFLCDKLNVPLQFTGGFFQKEPEKWWNIFNQDKVIDFYKRGLGILTFKNMYLNEEYVNENPLSLGGHTIGVLYQIHPFMRNFFGKSFVERVREEVKYLYQGRYLFTENFVKNINTPFQNKIFRKLQPSAPDSLREYILSMSVSKYFPSKVGGNTLPKSLKALEEDYLAYKEDTLLKPLLKESFGLDSIEALTRDPMATLKFAQLIRYATNVQSAAINTKNYSKAGNFVQIDPAVEGPMINFLHSLPVTFREVFYPKGLEFEYFKRELGYPFYGITKGFHYDIAAKSSFSYLRSQLNKRIGKKSVKNGAKNKKKSNLKSEILNSEQFKKHYLKYFKRKDSALLPLIQDNRIRDYLAEQYKSIEKENFPDFFIVNQILNAEILFRSIQEENSVIDE